MSLQRCSHQLMVNCWFGARWFGFLGSPYERDCSHLWPESLSETLANAAIQLRDPHCELLPFNQRFGMHGKRGKMLELSIQRSCKMATDCVFVFVELDNLQFFSAPKSRCEFNHLNASVSSSLAISLLNSCILYRCNFALLKRCACV